MRLNGPCYRSISNCIALDTALVAGVAALSTAAATAPATAAAAASTTAALELCSIMLCASRRFSKIMLIIG